LLNPFDISLSSTCNLDRARSKFDNISGILMSAKSGIRYLQQQIGQESKDYTENNVINESDLASILWSTGDTVVELMARIQEAEMNNLHDIDVDNVTTESSLLETSLEYEVKLQGSRPFNQRIKLPSARDPLFENDHTAEVGYNDIDDDEISRDRVKKKAIQVIRAQFKHSKVKDSHSN